MVNEVEAALEAEPGLSDEQVAMLRASAYDTYDVLVTCDELLNRRGARALALLCLCSV